VVLSDDVLVGNMLKEIEKLSDLVEKVELFDVYRGEKVGEGLKSVAVNMIFRAQDRTLNEEEVTKLFNDVLLMIEKKFAGKLRSI
jgi:phenylalanyl-tRNA synthetase beta chain